MNCAGKETFQLSARWMVALCIAAVMGVSEVVAAPLTWNNGTANMQWDTTSANWVGGGLWNNSTPDSAIFGATGAGSITVGTIQSSGVTVSGASYTLSSGNTSFIVSSTGTGPDLTVSAPLVNKPDALTVPAGLTKTGAGKMLLSANNTYTGPTMVSGGTLQLGAGTSGKDGAIASTNIVNNAALVFNLFGSSTYAGVISGTGTLTKSGAATLVLSNANTYSGTTTVVDGTLQLTVAGALPPATDLVLSSNAKLDLTGVDQTVNTLTLDGVLKMRGNCTWGSTSSGATYQDNNYFVGTGKLTVLGPLSKGTVIVVW